MQRATLTRIWRVGRWALVVLVLAAIVKRALRVLQGGPSLHNVPFHEWYGDWREVALVTAIFLVFLLGFAWPRRRVEWQSAGLYAAFLISLFTEMFGVPLTIYLIAPALGLTATNGRSPAAFGVYGHPATILIDRAGRVVGRVRGERDWATDDARRLVEALLAAGR